ncbi:DUF2322 family protein [Ursidibacter arcticus]|uniref:DUF2322 family protein n=1 Tax=Ursidibacter arcticus TaxID=1524965 RepID=UPI0012FCDBFD|nr:DUF2322 family protein [Ursidibacter arcticus]KAE9532444.1 hypothetical protein A1D25_09140 [Ursidibacter arcticus]
MQFKENLATFPDISHLDGLDVVDLEGNIIHHIPAVEGKLGSLKLYNALATKFGGQLNKDSAQQGLVWFAEYVDDARLNIGKHPNIDLLFNVIEQDHIFVLKEIKKI